MGVCPWTNNCHRAIPFIIKGQPKLSFKIGDHRGNKTSGGLFFIVGKRQGGKAVPVGNSVILSLFRRWDKVKNYFADTLSSEHDERHLAVFDETDRWLDIYFKGTL